MVTGAVLTGCWRVECKRGYGADVRGGFFL